MPFSCHNPAVLGLAFAGGSTLAWPIHDNASHTAPREPCGLPNMRGQHGTAAQPSCPLLWWGASWSHPEAMQVPRTSCRNGRCIAMPRQGGRRRRRREQGPSTSRPPIASCGHGSEQYKQHQTEPGFDGVMVRRKCKI